MQEFDTKYKPNIRQKEGIQMNEKLTLSVEEMGKMLGVSRQVAFSLVHRADFPVLRIGKRILVPKKQLEEWMDRQVNGEEPYEEAM
ncbi:MAG: helix-turn-helix domain-containing protein [Clostridia bacterium]|nr:helix-turn-helix domain-containing protein [Clostridia bacterium]